VRFGSSVPVRLRGRKGRPTTTPETDNDLLPEYDFRVSNGAVRGKFVGRGPRFPLVKVAEDLIASFADEAAVNAALRDYLRLTASQQPVQRHLKSDGMPLGLSIIFASSSLPVVLYGL